MSIMVMMKASVYWPSRKSYPLKVSLYFWTLYSPIMILTLIAAPPTGKLKYLLFLSLVSLATFFIIKLWCNYLRKESFKNYRALKKIPIAQIESSEVVHVKKMIFGRFIPSPSRSAQKSNSLLRIGVEYGAMLNVEFNAYLVPNPRITGLSNFNILKRLGNPSYFVVPCEQINLKTQRKIA